MHIATDLELAYLAGVVDADGYVAIGRNAKPQRVYFTALVGITGCKREPHDLAAAIFGGNVNVARGRGCVFGWYWQRSGVRAEPVLAALMPYLRIKRRQAALALEIQETIAAERHLPPTLDPRAPYADLTHQMEELRDQCKALNIRRAGRVPGRTNEQLGGYRPGSALEDLPEDLRIREFPREAVRQ